MKLWLDDVRPAPDGWIWVKNARQAIMMLQSADIEQISLDHDLGDERSGSGYEVAVFIERNAADGTRKPPQWQIHSANPVGCYRMKAAMESADTLWDYWVKTTGLSDTKH